MGFIIGISQLGGIVSDFLDGIMEKAQLLLNAYLDILSNTGYVLFLGIAKIIDLVQLLFKKLAGLDVYRFSGDTSNSSGDIVIGLITSDAVINVLISLIILSVVLLFITTFIAVLKSQYEPLDIDRKVKTTIPRTIGKSLRALFNFFAVPVIVIFALIVSNGLLSALDQATSSGDTLLSSRIFQSAAYNCNRARFDEDFYDRLTSDTEILVWTDDGYQVVKRFPNGINGFGIFTSEYSQEEVSALIDEYFVQELDVPEGYEDSYALELEGFDILDIIGTIGVSVPETFSMYNYRMVWFYYDLSQFNFLVGIGIAIGLIIVLLQVLLGLMKRIYSLIMLFIISPTIIALSPINNDAFNNWKKLFIKDALSAYSVVVVLNLFIMLIPVICGIEFFPVTASMGSAQKISYGYFNYLSQAIMLLAGAMFFKDLTKAIGEMIGAGSAMTDGGDKAAGYAKTAAKVGGAAAMLAVPGVAAAKMAMGAAQGAVGGGLASGAKAVKNVRNQGIKQGAWSNVKGVGKAVKNKAGAAKGHFNQEDADGNKKGILKTAKDRWKSRLNTAKEGAKEVGRKTYNTVPHKAMDEAFKDSERKAKLEKRLNAKIAKENQAEQIDAQIGKTSNKQKMDSYVKAQEKSKLENDDKIDKAQKDFDKLKNKYTKDERKEGANKEINKAKANLNQMKSENKALTSKINKIKGDVQKVQNIVQTSKGKHGFDDIRTGKAGSASMKNLIKESESLDRKVKNQAKDDVDSKKS